MTSSSLRRGLAVFALFVIRGFHAQGGSACDVGAAPVSAVRQLHLNGVSNQVVAGQTFTVDTVIEIDTATPISPYCDDSRETDEEHDERESGYFGCGGETSTEATCEGNWVTTTNEITQETAQRVTATCGAGCTAIVNADGVISVTTSENAVLQVSAVSPTTGETVSTSSPINIVADVPRIAAALATSPLLPSNVLLLGQTVTWCVVEALELDIAPMTVTVTGALKQTSSTPGCASFEATAAGTAHLVFARTRDGKAVSADVDVVDPSAVAELQFVTPAWRAAAGMEAYSVTDLVSSANALPDPSSPYYGDDNSDETCVFTAAARFYTADGKVGLVPALDLTADTAHQLAVARVGTVSTSIALETAESCE